MNYQNSRRLVLGLLVCAGAVIVWQRNSANHTGNPQHQNSAPSTAVASLATRAHNNSSVTAHEVGAQTSGKFQILNDPAAVPVWAVKFGGEFWRHHLPGTGEEAAAGKASTLINPPFSLGDVIDRVSHAANID